MASNRVVVTTPAPDAGDKKKKKKLPYILAGVGVLALVPVIGSTFAASITLGSGDINFAQGSQTTAACDSNIDVALESTVDAGDFKLQKVTLSDLDLTTCAGKTFRVYAVDGSNNTLDWVASGTALGTFTIPATASSSATATALTGLPAGLSGSLTDASDVIFNNSNAYTSSAKVGLTVATPNVASSSVSKILLETTN